MTDPVAAKRLGEDLQEKAAAARERLDSHVREIIGWHFNPKTGAPFWLEFAEKGGGILSGGKHLPTSIRWKISRGIPT